MLEKLFYRIADHKCVIGDVMQGRGERPLAAKETLIEEILERRRPKEQPDRGDSVYMRKEREFSTVGVSFDSGYVHLVKPIGECHQRDLGWIGVLQRRHHKNTRLRKESCPTLSDDEIADKYWQGDPSAAPIWEWVAKEAEVIAVDQDTSCVRARSNLLDAFVNKKSEM